MIYLEWSRTNIFLTMLANTPLVCMNSSKLENSTMIGANIKRLSQNKELQQSIPAEIRQIIGRKGDCWHIRIIILICKMLKLICGIIWLTSSTIRIKCAIWIMTNTEYPNWIEWKDWTAFNIWKWTKSMNESISQREANLQF